VRAALHILLPVHNRRATTTRFVHALAEQTKPDFHLLLLDDGSTDGTAEAVRNLWPATEVLTGDGTWWWAGALAKGCDHLARSGISDHDVLLFINDDVELAPDFIERAHEEFASCRDTLLLARQIDAATGREIDYGGGVHADLKRLRFRAAQNAAEINCLPTRGLFLRWRDYRNVGGFRAERLPHYLSDYEFTLRAHRAGLTLRVANRIHVRVHTGETGRSLANLFASPRRARFGLLFSPRFKDNPLTWSHFVGLAVNPWHRWMLWLKIWVHFCVVVVRCVFRPLAATASSHGVVGMPAGGEVRALARRLTPGWARVAIRRWRAWVWFRGDYDSWPAAVAASGGYGAEAIVERVLAATLEVQAGRAAFERDSVLFFEPEPETPLAEALEEVRRRIGRRLRVLDFGGSLGTTYWRLRHHVAVDAVESWNVVEQPNFVAAGRRHLHEPRLGFFDTIAEAERAFAHDVLLCSGTLQYLAAPREMLQTWAALRMPYVLLNNLPLHSSGPTRLRVQHVPPSIYRASYPVWFFNRAEFLGWLATSFEIVHEFASEAVWPVDGAMYPSTGLLLRRRASPTATAALTRSAS
jgi:putative methyltransferase (TIGR04325 family)